VKRSGTVDAARQLGGLLLAALFAGVVVATPLSMATCPRHQAGLHAAGTGVSGHPMPHAGHTDTPADGPREPHGPCNCLEHCCPGTVIVGPLPPAAVSPVAPRNERPAHTAPRSLPTVAPDPWMLPYPNGPPAHA